MIRTYKDFPKLNFPLYPLPNSNWLRADGVLFLDGRILDDRKQPGETLGVRRIQSRRKKQDLYPLRRAVFTLPELLQCKTRYFIDSKGVAFEYVKTQSSLLRTYKIKAIDKKEIASILWLCGVNHPITIPRPPLNNPGWARMLHLGPSPWKLYDYVFSYQADTYRRI